MAALNFQARFADDVEAGRKTQTIRQERKRPIKPGDRLYLYTGMRTKNCRKLGEAVCGHVNPLRIRWRNPEFGSVSIYGSPFRLEELARRDGFDSVSEMVLWLEGRYGLPFEGVLIRWTLGK